MDIATDNNNAQLVDVSIHFLFPDGDTGGHIEIAEISGQFVCQYIDGSPETNDTFRTMMELVAAVYMVRGKPAIIIVADDLLVAASIIRAKLLAGGLVVQKVSFWYATEEGGEFILTEAPPWGMWISLIRTAPTTRTPFAPIRQALLRTRLCRTITRMDEGARIELAETGPFGRLDQYLRLVRAFPLQ